MSKLVSVIVPTYNRSSLMMRSLMSVYNQTYRPIELIIIDDGSTDNTREVVESYKQKYSADNFAIVYEKTINKGAPAARNRGLSLANGEYVQFLDSDDYLKVSKIESQILAITNESLDVVTCDYEREFDKNELKYTSNKSPDRIMFNCASIHISTPLIEAGIARKIKWDISLNRNQDVDYLLKLFLITNKIKHINESLSVYVQHDSDRIRDNYRKYSNIYIKRAYNIIKFMKYNYHITRPNAILLSIKVIIILLRKHITKSLKNIITKTKQSI